MRNLLFLSLLAICLITSCSKSTTVTPAPTNTELISATTWQPNKVTASVGLTLTAYTKGGTGNLIDFSKFKLTLAKDGKYTAINYDGTATAGTWKFTNSEKSFEQTDGATGEIVAWDILALTATTFNVTHTINLTKPSKFDQALIDFGKSVGIAAPAGSSLGIELIP